MKFVIKKVVLEKLKAYYSKKIGTKLNILLQNCCDFDRNSLFLQTTKTKKTFKFV